MSNHVLITGPGRAGTTFLMRVLTHLGLPTGFADAVSGLSHPESHAGYECNMLAIDNPPYICKSPTMGGQITRLIAKGFSFDRLYVCLRNIEDSANSRAEFIERGGHPICFAQAYLQTVALSAVPFVAAAKHRIPVDLLWFPDLILDPLYCYQSLFFLMRKYDVSFAKYVESHRLLADQSLIHHG